MAPSGLEASIPYTCPSEGHHAVVSRLTTAHRFVLPVIAFALALLPQAIAQTHYNHDESAVPQYNEPDVLRLNDGGQVDDAQEWTTQRRPQLLSLLESQMFGRYPAKKVRLRVTALGEGLAFNGLALRRQVTLAPAGDAHKVAMHLLIYTPRAAQGPVPLFLGLNYGGNQSVTSDQGVDLGTIWVADADNRLHMHSVDAPPATRGAASSEWPIETMLRDGFGFATIYDGDLEPDFDGGFAFGFRSLPALSERDTPDGERWGAIGIWSWGLSRALDYLSTDSHVNAKKVVVIGHSRLGKTALWAGASDPRFAMVISNESGKGGAAIMKRNFGETVEHLNTRFPYWFDGNFRKYSDNESAMPFDSHFLLALIAPRPLYVASAAGDSSLDARGEYIALRMASPVYALYGLAGVSSLEPPALDTPVMSAVGYHNRQGKHDMTSYDWEQYLSFAKVKLLGSSSAQSKLHPSAEKHRQRGEHP